MSKTVKEDCRFISIYKFKEWNRLDSSSSGTITWTDSWDNKSWVSYSMNLDDKSNMYFKLSYTANIRSTNEKKEVEHTYPIIVTPCNYGKERYWFECSMYKHGKYCGRRVAKLYMGGGSHYFACRHCHELTYQARLDGWTYGLYDAEKYSEKIKKWYYKGKATKKHVRYDKLLDNTYKQILELSQRLNLKK